MKSSNLTPEEQSNLNLTSINQHNFIDALDYIYETD